MIPVVKKDLYSSIRPLSDFLEFLHLSYLKVSYNEPIFNFSSSSVLLKSKKTLDLNNKQQTATKTNKKQFQGLLL